MSNTPEGGKKTAATVKKLYGKDFYRKIGAKGGKAVQSLDNPNRPMRDPEYARKLINIRWAKYRYEHGTISLEELERVKAKLHGGDKTNV